jgi:hypothetical protein
MKKNHKLTSVHLVEDLYKKFKVKAIDGEINLQKLVNRSLDLYNTDESFRKQINSHDKLTTSGTKF